MSFPVDRFSPGNVWTPMWEKETKEYKDPAAAKKSGEDCQASLNVYPPSPLHIPPQPSIAMTSAQGRKFDLGL